MLRSILSIVILLFVLQGVAQKTLSIYDTQRNTALQLDTGSRVTLKLNKKLTVIRADLVKVRESEISTTKGDYPISQVLAIGPRRKGSTAAILGLTAASMASLATNVSEYYTPLVANLTLVGFIAGLTWATIITERNRAFWIGKRFELRIG